MPEPTPRDPVLAMRRQLARVRWRKNLYELQRALYAVIAVAALATSAGVLLALRAGATGFAVGAAAIALGAAAATGTVGAATRRRWLGARRAAGWIDARAKLQGRLATAMELVPRTRDASFLPLLVEQNVRRLRAWEPDRVLPDVFPYAALGVALVATSLFLLVLRAAPDLRPPRSAIESQAIVPARLRPTAERGGVPVGAEDEREPGAPGRVARLAADLQERIRERAWGREWQSAAASHSQEMPSAPAAIPVDDDQLERGWQIARGSTQRPSGDRPDRAAADDDAHGERSARGADPTRARRQGAAGDDSGPPAAGAGSATDPNLYGRATTDVDGSGGFELPLAARVRTVGGGPRPPSGEAPPAAADARPGLAARPRRDAPVLRMAVPAAYEAIVRQLFARRTDEATP